MGSAVRLLVADDDVVLRRGVRVTLENHANRRVVAKTRDGREAVEKAVEFRPDVAILDYPRR
jgi:DNA-binding NarL/FixJ family response regulator